MKKIIIGSGHGEDTAGKRSVFHKILYKGKYVARFKENNFNEAIANKISVLHDNCVFITNEWYDVSLYDRVKREWKEYTDNSIFISIHADAYRVKDVATGGRFYYYSEYGKTIAIQLTKYLVMKGYDLRPPKKADFYVLKHSKSPAVLFEADFYTTTSSLEKLEDENYRNKLAKDLTGAFKTL